MWERMSYMSSILIERAASIVRKQQTFRDSSSPPSNDDDDAGVCPRGKMLVTDRCCVHNRVVSASAQQP